MLLFICFIKGVSTLPQVSKDDKILAATKIQRWYRLRKMVDTIINQEEQKKIMFFEKIWQELSVIRDDCFTRYLQIRTTSYGEKYPGKFIAWDPIGSSAYQRDDPAEYYIKKVFLKMDQKNYLNLIANSRVINEKLKYFEARQGIYPIAGSNLFRLPTCPNFYKVGGMPSIYSLARYLEPPIDKNKVPDDESKNVVDEFEKVLQRAQFFSMDTIKEIPETSASSYILINATVGNMLNGLREMMAHCPAHDAFVLKLIEHLDKAVNNMLIRYPKDFIKVSRAYEWIYNIIFVLLAYIPEQMKRAGIESPLIHPDYQAIMGRVFAERNPDFANGFRVLHYPTFGGMSSLSTAYVAARKNLGNVNSEIFIPENAGKDDPNYFEIDNLQKFEKAPNRIVFANFYPNKSISFDINIKELVSKIEKDILEQPGYMVLILDTTNSTFAEKDKAVEFLRAVKYLIAQGKLKVFLCKSYQKFGALCTGKIMAGDLTFIDNNDAFEVDFLEKAGADYKKTDEYYMFCHILKYNPYAEFYFIDKAAKNTEFVDKYCMPPRDDYERSKRVGNFPFLMRKIEYESDLMKSLHCSGVRYLDSYGYLNSSVLVIDALDLDTGEKGYSSSVARITLGLEPQDLLVEKFYAVGHLYDKITEFPKMNDLIKGIEAIGADPFLIENPKFKNAALLSYCRLADLLTSGEKEAFDTWLSSNGKNPTPSKHSLAWE